MKTRCDEIAQLLDNYMDGELAEETARTVDRHLLRCPACTYELRTLEQTRVMLRETFAPSETSPSFRERTAARLLDAFADHLQSAPSPQSPGQWELPFAVNR